MRPRDPGLQPERTSLAWGRTSLAMMVTGLIALRLALESMRWPMTVGAMLLIAEAVWAFLISRPRVRSLAAWPFGSLSNALAWGMAALCVTGSGCLLFYIAAAWF